MFELLNYRVSAGVAEIDAHGHLRDGMLIVAAQSRSHAMKNAVLFCALTSLAIAAASAHAHHSRAAYDQSKTVEIRGTVVDFKLRSPHSSLVVDGIAFIDGKRQSQSIERWELESEALPALKARGINADTFKAGDTVALEGHPHRTAGFRFAQLVTFVSVNGRPLDAEPTRRAAAMREATSNGGAAGASDAVGVARIAGLWVPNFIPPGNGSALPLNEAGLAAWRNYDPKLSPANTCEPMSIPEIYHAPFYLFRISLTSRQAVLYNEAYEIRRTVPLDGEPAAADPAGRFGTVVGRIDGDALVIESRGYPPSRWGLGAATQLNGGGADVPSSEQKTVTERFSVSDDGRKLIYDYTLGDPVYLSHPYERRLEFLRMPADTPIYPYECDLESASMFSRGPGDAPLRIGK
jgi:hypothetical protein